MPDEEQAPNPEQPAEPPPEPNPDSTPFEAPTYEKVERGISGPWEKRNDDD